MTFSVHVVSYNKVKDFKVESSRVVDKIIIHLAQYKPTVGPNLGWKSFGKTVMFIVNWVYFLLAKRVTIQSLLFDFHLRIPSPKMLEFSSVRTHKRSSQNYGQIHFYGFISDKCWPFPNSRVKSYTEWLSPGGNPISNGFANPTFIGIQSPRYEYNFQTIR